MQINNVRFLSFWLMREGKQGPVTQRRTKLRLQSGSLRTNARRVKLEQRNGEGLGSPSNEIGRQGEA